MFKDVLSGESSFEATDGGEELFKVFLEYQYLLKRGNTDKTKQYEAHVYRRGIGAIKLKDLVQHSTRGRDGGGNSKGRSSRPFGPKRAYRQVETGFRHPDAGLALSPVVAVACSDFTSTGNITTSSTLGRRSHPTMASSVMQPESPVDSPLPEFAKPSKRSKSKQEKKRKASSQKSPFSTPDASEDDNWEPSKTYTVTAANSISHRSKRIASNPSRQPHDLPGVKNQVDKTNSAHGPKANKQHREVTSISQSQSPPTSFWSEDSASHSKIKGRRGAGFPLSSRKHYRGRFLNASTKPTRASSNSRGLRKTKSVRGLQPPARKRMRRASMSTLDSEPGEVSDSTHDLRVKLPQEPAVQGSLASGPPSIQRNVHVESKARRKRTRLEFESAFASDEVASADSYECLGPDNRVLRPLPKKVCSVRLVPVADEDRAIGVPCGVSSLEHADQLVRDVASNELAILREGVGTDLPDWTQDKEHDAECDDSGVDDQDEENDVQVTTATSAPSKPPVPAPPRIWAHVSCFIASQCMATDH